MSSILTQPRQPIPNVSPKISYEDFLEHYDGVHAEWVDGKVILMSPVSNVHQRIGLFLARLISDFVEDNDLGLVFYAAFQMKSGVTSPGREPDLIFVSKDRLPLVRRNHFDGPGDLVVEIISPESIQRDRVTKFEEYQQAGVKEYWLIDPLTQQATFFQLDASDKFQAIISDDEGKYHSHVLPGLWIKTDWLWQFPSPLLSQVRKELGLL